RRQLVPPARALFPGPGAAVRGQHRRPPGLRGRSARRAPLVERRRDPGGGRRNLCAAPPGRPAAAAPGGGAATGADRRRALSQTGVRVPGLDNVTLARATMGTSLGFHIVFAVLGVGLPALLVVAEGLWLRTGDEVWLGLARRWSRAFAILFAVGAVSGTVLSFELGLLWPRFMAFSGSIIGLPSSAERFAF